MVIDMIDDNILCNDFISAITDFHESMIIEDKFEDDKHRIYRNNLVDEWDFNRQIIKQSVIRSLNNG